MGQAEVAGLIVVGGTLLIGGLVAVPAPDAPWRLADRSGLSGVVDVARDGVGVVIARLGRVPAAAGVMAFGIGIVMLICWPVGILARNSQGLDNRVLHWAESHQVGWLTSLMDVLTQMGNRPVTKPVTLAAIMILVLIRRQRRWVPAVVLLAAYVLEFYFQTLLEHAVHRADPPTSGGNYPSGGCARLIITYGLLIWFLLRERRRTSVGRPEIVGWATLLAGAGVLEAYSRTYLLKHWVSDTVGGLVFGGILLATLMSMAWVLDRPGPLFLRPEPQPDSAVLDADRSLVPMEG